MTSIETLLFGQGIRSLKPGLLIYNEMRQDREHRLTRRTLDAPPIRRLPSRGNTSPLTQLLTFFPLCSTRHTPPPLGDLRRIRVFIAWRRLLLRRTSHPSGSRLLDASLPSQTSAPGTLRAPENPRFPAASKRIYLTDDMAPSRVQRVKGSRQRRHKTPPSGGRPYGTG
jgi:hypothetical protein